MKLRLSLIFLSLFFSLSNVPEVEAKPAKGISQSTKAKVSGKIKPKKAPKVKSMLSSIDQDLNATKGKVSSRFAKKSQHKGDKKTKKNAQKKKKSR